jgi:methyl-accepting chemotaxis protein
MVRRIPLRADETCSDPREEVTMGFNRFKIGTRIWIGFGALIILSVSLAGFGVYKLSDVGTETGTMTFLMGRAMRVMDATHRLEAVRRAETRMRIDGADYKDATDNATLVREELTEALRVSQSEQRRRNYASLLDVLTSHDADLTRFAQYTKTWTDRRAALFTGGDALAAASNRLVAAARAANNPALSEAASSVNAAVLLVRIANWRFMATSDQAGPATFKTNRANATAAITALQALAPPEVAVLVSPLQMALDTYEADFNGFSTARLAAGDLYENTMRVQLKTMQDMLDLTVASLKESLATATANSTSIIASSSLTQEILAVVAFIIGASLALLTGRGISRPVNAMTNAMIRLAAGDRDVEVPARDNTDEIGSMARAVEVFRQNAITKVALEETQTRDQAVQARRQEEIGQLVGFFGRSVGGVLSTLAQASANMTESSTALEQSATETGSQTNIVLNEVEQTAQTVQTVAAAAQQLSSSIEEIGRQASDSQRISTAAMRQSDEVVDKVAELRTAAEQIGTVVELISSIAGQTNLLALNATIEAARAGDAGKGFAVVASEVKSLAAQTAKATEQIGGQIGAIQAATVRAAEAIQGIAGTVREVNEIAMGIAAAVVEQAAATQEIARSVELVSGNTANVAQSMERVRGAVGGNGETASEVRRTAATLSVESSTLSGEVTDFLAALNELGDGKHLLSYDLNVAATVILNGQTISGRVAKMSPGTALFVGPLSASPGALLELRVDGFDRPLRARYVEASSAGAHLQLSLDHDHLIRAEQTLARLGMKAAA